jgi:hypothetical protein
MGGQQLRIAPSAICEAADSTDPLTTLWKSLQKRHEKHLNGKNSPKAGEVSRGHEGSPFFLFGAWGDSSPAAACNFSTKTEQELLGNRLSSRVSVPIYR